MAREMFPGKSNSLDALCRRLEVDNSNRTLHGALLDAGLLAEVYIRMTRGQDSLVIDVATGDGGRRVDGVGVDLSAFELPVVEPSDDELAAHARCSPTSTRPAAAGRCGAGAWHNRGPVAGRLAQG